MKEQTHHSIRRRIGDHPIATGFTLTAILVLILVWMSGGNAEREEGEEAAVQSFGAARAASLPNETRENRGNNRTPVSDSIRSRDGRRGVITVKARETLATVNGRVIRLEHLASRERGDESVTMTRQELRMRLDRAVEAELVFQEAEARGVQFSRRQQARLDRIPTAHEIDLYALRPWGITWNSLNEEHVHLERRLMKSMILRQNLVAQETGARPSPRRDAQAEYEDALDRMMQRLRDDAEIALVAVR